jgi:putative two-component system response regulator
LEEIVSNPMAQLPQDPALLKLQLLKLHSSLQERTASSDRDSIEFAHSCVRRLSSIRGAQFLESRFECLERCVPYFYASARLEHALEAASEMLEVAQRAQRRDWIRRARNYLGVIHGEMGDVASAIGEYHEALRLALMLGDARGTASTIQNLGTVFLYGGLFAEAKQCFHKALQLFPIGNRHDECIPSIHSNLAQANFLLGMYDEAFDAISRCLHLPFTPETLKEFHSRTLHELTFVRIAVTIGRIEEAMAHVESCRQFAQQAGGRQSITNFELAKGLVNCFAGDAYSGLRLLEEALRSSESYGVTARVMALEILACACQACGRPDRALPYIQEALSGIRAQRERELEALFSLNSDLFNRRIADGRDLQAFTQKEASLRAAAAELQLANAQLDMLERLAITATLKEDPTGAHGYRVGSLSSLLAAELGWPRDRCSELEVAARLHDIGKVAIPDSVALSDRAFESTQRQIMQSHTTIGAELLGNHTGHAVRLASEVARHHHEWWDGTGYPARLRGDRIPMSCRIVALADVFDALTHGRKYAAASPLRNALEEIVRLSSLQFDPALVPIFVSLIQRLENRHSNLDEFLGAAARSSPYFSARRKIEAIVRDQAPATL